LLVKKEFKGTEDETVLFPSGADDARRSSPSNIVPGHPHRLCQPDRLDGVVETIARELNWCARQVVGCATVGCSEVQGQRALLIHHVDGDNGRRTRQSSTL